MDTADSKFCTEDKDFVDSATGSKFILINIPLPLSPAFKNSEIKGTIASIGLSPMPNKLPTPDHKSEPTEVTPEETAPAVDLTFSTVPDTTDFAPS